MLAPVLLLALLLGLAGCDVPPRPIHPPPPPADATQFLQRELDRGGRLLLPRLAGDRCYQTRGLWIMRPGTRLESNGACLEVTGPGPVRLRSPDGDPIAANAALYVTRTFGIRISNLRLIVPEAAATYGIAVFGRNVRVDRVTVAGRPIDALLVGGRGSKPARDIAVTRSRLLGGRRNVISIVSAVGLEIRDTTIAGATGDFELEGGGSPSAGIDVEPDDSEDPVEDVRIAGNRITRNAGPGILLALSTSSGLPVRASRIVIVRNRIVANSRDPDPPQRGGIAFQGGQADGRGWVRVAENVIRGNGGFGLQGHPTEGTILRLDAVGNDLGGNERGETSFVRLGRGSRLG